MPGMPSASGWLSGNAPRAISVVTTGIPVMSTSSRRASAAWALEREAFTVAKYDLEIRLEPEQQRLGARGKITVRNDSCLLARTKLSPNLYPL